MTKVTEVSVPDIGDFSEVEIIEVHVRTDDEVGIEDPLITLESDKATMDIPSPVKGKVVQLQVTLGDRVSTGDPVLTIETPDSAVEPQSAADESSPPQADMPPASDEVAAESIEEVRRVQIPSPEATQNSRGAVHPEKSYAPPPTLPPPVERAQAALPHASPSVRRFARELGADLTLVRGSGAKERILKEDVKAWVKERLRTGTTKADAGGTGIPPLPEIDFSQFGPVEVGALPRIKKISGPHLHRAWLNVPHVTHHDEADITELEAFRKTLKEEAEQRGVRVTLLSFVMLSLVAALKKFPHFNASLSSSGENLIFKRYYHLGIAVDTPHGLMVPVFRDVDKKSLFELAAEMGEVSDRAREGKLRPDELQGGCMSVSSLGGIGGAAFTPIVNAPEVAILGISRARMQPVWDGKAFVPRLLLPLDLSYDHRVIDGAEAARFVAYLGRLLGDLRRLLL